MHKLNNVHRKSRKIKPVPLTYMEKCAEWTLHPGGLRRSGRLAGSGFGDTRKKFATASDHEENAEVEPFGPEPGEEARQERKTKKA